MGQPSYVMSLYVRLLWYYVLLVGLASGIFVIVTGLLLIGIIVVVIVLAFGYWTLFRVAHRLVIDGDTLHWFAPLSRGAAPLGDLTSLLPTVMQSVMIFTFGTERSVQTMTSRGFVEFAKAIGVAAPGARIRLNAFDRIRNELPASEPFPPELKSWDEDDFS